MVYNDSRVLPFAFFSSLFLFCPSVPSFEAGNGWSIRVKEMKNVIRIHYFHSSDLSSPPLKIGLVVLRKPEVCWGHYITNLKAFRKEALYSSWNPLEIYWTHGLVNQLMPLASNMLITSLKLEALFGYFCFFFTHRPIIILPDDNNCKDVEKCYRVLTKYWFLCLIKISNFKVGETPLIYRFGYGLAF